MVPNSFRRKNKINGRNIMISFLQTWKEEKRKKEN